MNFKSVGTWWNDRDIELVEIDGTVYALSGWNGESYADSWKCTGEHLTDASVETYDIAPIYNGDEDTVISYDVTKN